VPTEPPPSPPGGNVSTYPGQRLGLPEDGPGSVPGWGRRFLALFLDWFASLLVAGAIAGRGVTGAHGWRAWLPLAVFLLESAFLVALMGGSFGQLITRIVVVRRTGGPVSLLRALLRSALVCLVVPPLIYNRDRRGLHDLAADTVALRR
jgi:uncharacterized RDD family membrane protein YckC